MKKISLVPYTIRIKRMYGKEEEKLDNFGEKSSDILPFLTKTLSALKDQDWRDESGEKIFGINKVLCSERLLSGISETGEYGSGSIIKDVVAGKVVLKKKRIHAEVRPFYYLLSIPKERRKGIILLQTRGALGIATVFRDALNRAFQLEFPDYRIHLRNLTTRAVFDKFLAGNLREMRFIRFHLPKGIEDTYSEGHKEIKGVTEFVVRPKGLMGMPFAKLVRDIVDGKSALKDLVELADEHFEANNVKLNMEVDGKLRVLSVVQPDNVQIGYDITEDVKYDEDRNPELDSIDALARGFLSELETAMYGPG